MMLAAAGCGDSGPNPPDGGPPLALDIVGDGTRGLIFGQSQPLAVRLHSADPDQRPFANATVRFSIFRDPAGSTLASDHARTDSDGVATVLLTAGQAQTSFNVIATTNNAPDVQFEIRVAASADDFVELDVALAWPDGDPKSTVLRVALFDDRGCADLPPATTQPAPFTAASATGIAATLRLQSLLRLNYAVVGRAEDANKRLLGYGCVQVGPGLLPPASTSNLPLPLSPVSATPVGTYAVTSQLMPAAAATTPVLAKWRTLECVNGAAQLLLDAMAVDQGPADGIGCKRAPIDAELQNALGSSGTQLAAIYADLKKILGSAQLASALTVTPAGDHAYTAAHRLGTITFSAASGSMTYDLGELGLPVIAAANIATSYDGKMLTLGAHGFTLGWHSLWAQALTDLAPGMPSLPSLMTEIVAGAKSGGFTGCAAVADLCAGACTVSACNDAAAAIGAGWQASLAPQSAIDLVLAGHAGTTPSAVDLTVGKLELGSWTSAQLASGTFTGARAQ
jgi:hypothetical protein